MFYQGICNAVKQHDAKLRIFIVDKEKCGEAAVCLNKLGFYLFE